jgi:hypothetical protein
LPEAKVTARPERSSLQVVSPDNENRLSDLEMHFLRSGFSVECVGGSMIEVRRAGDGNDVSAIAFHLRAWEAVNPETRVVILP